MSSTMVSDAGVSEMISAIWTASSRVDGADAFNSEAPLVSIDSMVKPSCTSFVYVHDERTRWIQAEYTRNPSRCNPLCPKIRIESGTGFFVPDGPGRVRTCDRGVMSPLLCH